MTRILNCLLRGVFCNIRGENFGGSDDCSALVNCIPESLKSPALVMPIYLAVRGT